MEIGKNRIGFIGAGKVGRALGIFFRQKGVPVSGYFSRSASSAREAVTMSGGDFFETPGGLVEASETVFLTVPDDQIQAVWEQIRKEVPETDLNGKVFCHTSGCFSSECFSHIRQTGAYGLSIHPLLAVSDPERSAGEIQEALFTIEGSREALPAMRVFLEGLGLRVVEIAPEDKAKYHAAAVLASNCVLALLDAAEGQLCGIGFSVEQAREALGPLMTKNLEAGLRVGAKDALTGPVERGDLETVQTHLSVLPPDAAQIYRALSRQLVKLAKEKHPERGGMRGFEGLEGSEGFGETERFGGTEGFGWAEGSGASRGLEGINGLEASRSAAGHDHV